MQASLFKLLAIAAAFSAVHSAPVETAEATKAQVNGTQINDIFKVAGVRALRQRSKKDSYNAFYRFYKRLTPKFRLLRSSKPAIRRGTFLILAREERRESFSSGLAGMKAAGTAISAEL